MNNRFRKPYKVKKKKSIFKNFYFWLLVIGIAISIFLFYFFCFHSFFQVKEIKIFDNEEVPSQEIISLLEKEITRDILFWESKSIFFVEFKKLEERVLKEFPKIEEVSFGKDYPETITLFVKERKPVAIFEQEGRLFFLDKKGVVFKDASEKKDWLVIKSNERRNVDFGSSLFEEEIMEKILIAEEELVDSDINIVFFDIINYQRFNVLVEEGWEIYFNLEDDVVQQVLNLNLILEKEISPEKRDNLEYVDLRFGNQVYYK
jgi:hypothetical protein